MLFVVFSLLLYYFVFNFCQFEYYVSQCIPAWDSVLPGLD